jgi:hypothetical protein
MAISDQINLQARPSTAVTSWYMCKVSNKKTVQEFIVTLKPDTLASAIGRLDDVSVVNAHVNLISDDSSHTKCLCLRQGDVVDEAIGWIWQLRTVND